MGAFSKGCSVFLRLSELVSAAIVAGIVGRYLTYLDDANVPGQGRFIYTITIAGISLAASLVLVFPSRFNFLCFPLDGILFVAWMTAFGLMVGLTRGHGCSSTWYWTNWGYFWGGWWRVVPVTQITPGIVGHEACSEWFANEAFCFIGGMAWLGSMALGIYCVFFQEHEAPPLGPPTDGMMTDGSENYRENKTDPLAQPEP